MWSPTKSAVKDLVEIMYKYSDYLKKCLEKVKTNHSLTFPVRTLDVMQSLKLIQPKYVVKPTYASRYRSLTSHLDTIKKSLNQYVLMNIHLLTLATEDTILTTLTMPFPTSVYVIELQLVTALERTTFCGKYQEIRLKRTGYLKLKK